jgi:hypothetical protein
MNLRRRIYALSRRLYTNPKRAFPWSYRACRAAGLRERAEAIENVKDAIRKYLAAVEEQFRGEIVHEIEVAF